MFKGEYSFRGTHAEKVIRLTSAFDKKGNKLFPRNLDVYLMAPIVGFMYGRKSPLDKTGEATKIFPEQINNEHTTLWFTYRLIMLLDDKYETNFEERVSNAFRNYGRDESKQDEELYEEYVRGGVDVLYEKLIESTKNEEDYLKNLYDFMEDFDERYGQTASGVLDLVKLARS